jgi:hypothetical protein
LTQNPVKPSGFYLNYPSLDLFLYHLREGLGESEAKIQENHQEFWSNLPSHVHVPWEKESQEKDTDLLKLLTLISDKTTHRIPTQLDQKYPIGGYYYPVLLKDTYGLLLDVEVEDKDTYDVSCFASLKRIADEKQGDLGKIWMISGYRDLLSNQQPIDIAQAAYQVLMGKEWKPGNLGKGKFLGADIFDAWQSPQYWKSITDADKSPVLIIIYPNYDIMNEARKFYNDWLRLLCYRNKILWAYSQCRKNAETLQKRLSLLNDTILLVRESQLNLSELKEKLKVCTDYAIQLEQLEILKQSIEINLQNYQKFLEAIADCSREIGETQLEFLSDFTTIFEDKYLEQIIKDKAKFESGLRILENLTNGIRTLVEIERAERDRAFQAIVGIVGVGLGSGGIVASAAANYVTEIKTTPYLGNIVHEWSNLNVVLTFSFLSGLSLTLLIWFIFLRKYLRK